MKDNTITIHPTVKTSTIYALERIAEDTGTSIGKVLEKCLEDNPDFKKAKQEYIKS